MRLINRLEQHKELWPMLGILILFILLRLPSLIEPYWYGDEGIYHVIGDAMRNGRVLYQEIWDNKPPMLYLIYALFGPDQFMIRFVSLLFGLGSVIVFFVLTTKLFTKELTRIVATGIYAFLFATPFLEGNIANAENFMHLPTLLAAVMVINSLQSKRKEKNTLLAAGLLLGLSFLFKIVGIFDFFAFLVFLLLTAFQDRRINRSSLISYTLGHKRFFLGFLTPLAVCFIYFFFKGAIGDFISAILAKNISYVGYHNNAGIPQGLLLLKLIFLGFAVFFTGKLRKQFSMTSLFVIVWTVFSLFNAFFSQRPYTHYVLVLLPSFALFTGLLLEGEKKNRRFYLFSFLVMTVSVYAFFSIYSVKKVVGYYANYLAFIQGTKSVDSYQEFFDRDVPRDYDVAYFLKKHLRPNETIFVWGNSAQIYTLSGTLPPSRYTVAYHSAADKTSIEETAEKLLQNKPRFLVLMQDISYFPFSLPNYSYKATIQNIAIYERVY